QRAAVDNGAASLSTVSYTHLTLTKTRREYNSLFDVKIKILGGGEGGGGEGVGGGGGGGGGGVGGVWG
ncbi:hypothetical protein ABFP36_23775, partial [Salmonella enterica subsp. enterica serovar Kentucky]